MVFIKSWIYQNLTNLPKYIANSETATVFFYLYTAFT